MINRVLNPCQTEKNVTPQICNVDSLKRLNSEIHFLFEFCDYTLPFHLTLECAKATIGWQWWGTSIGVQPAGCVY